MTGLLALAVATLLPLAPTPGARAAEDDTATPLTVTLVRLTPSTIPPKGKIVLAGKVRNDSAETWTAINVHPFISSTPMTDREQLAAAASSAADTEICCRLYKIGQFAAIGDLLPGQTKTFRISLRVKDLGITGAPGVYWIGVHALGQNAAGRDDVADGRARTFIPLVGKDAPHTAVSLVVPLRERVRRDRIGRLEDTTEWSQLLADDGRLERIAALLTTSGGLPATMLVDPAVIDAVASITADNQPLSLGEVQGEGPSTTPSSTPGESPGESPSESVSPSRDVERLDPSDRSNAARWLAQVKNASSFQTVLGLGYADPDTASLARRRAAYVALAAKESAAAFERLDIDAIPTVAPVSGWLDDDALASVDKDAVVLVSDHSAPRTRTRWHTAVGQDLVFTDEQAASRRPRAHRAALTPWPCGSGSCRRPRCGPSRARPARWSSSSRPTGTPGPAGSPPTSSPSSNQPWLDLVPLDRAPAGTSPTFDAALGYPAAERHDEIGLANSRRPTRSSGPPTSWDSC